ncbi:hypothetical protein AVEN_207948-1 [Araneus ventricosus]|uniref:Uncharacterized protein n=1 Tax=Araneus ventricosus TaxID=182803 RepID=A0A4Y2SYB3_ARAVE|nr:hypothetical protein AVEN_207948-1 [Araneus ventricosus]
MHTLLQQFNYVRLFWDLRRFPSIFLGFYAQILSINVEVRVKRLSEKRRSSHHETAKPVFKCFKKIVEAIEELRDDRNQRSSSNSVACDV